MRTVCTIAACAAALLIQNSPRPGSLLAPGLELVYSSEGVDTPWVIDSVTHDTTFGGRRGCVRMRIRTSPAQQTAETRAYCADSATMYTWNSSASELRSSRPLVPNVTVEFVLSGGRKARYETARWTKEVIGGQVLDVLPTTVTTLDSLGRTVSRLRERFSVGLASATGGVFETPDMTAQGGWRTTRAFELVRIRTP